MKMRKTVRFVFLMLLAATIAVPLTFFASQSARADVPDGYTPIYTKDDLYAVRENLEGKYIQMADIVFTEEDYSEDGEYYNMGLGWTPIGTEARPFTGVYDGNGYYINGLRINAPNRNDCGLFGYIYGGSVTNVILENSCVKGYNYVGGIVGRIKSTVTYAVHIYSQIINCNVKGKVVGHTEVGGIAGYALSSIDNNIGRFDDIVISRCQSSTEVSGSSKVGGIAGNVRGGTNYSGGKIKLVITNCINTGVIKSQSELAGGIIGSAYLTELNTSYSIGNVMSVSEFGGCIGSVVDSSLNYCYYLYTSVGEDANTYGIPTDRNSLKRKGTYETFDFADIWTIDGDPDYPFAELRCFCIAGTISVNGDFIYGGTVSVDVSKVERLKEYSVEWYADGVKVGDGDPFTVPAEAVGKTLTATVVSTDVFKGAITSDGVTVGKAPCANVPAVSDVLETTSSSIQISTVPGQEYSLDGETWQPGGGFGNLDPGTSYTVLTRVAETDIYLASEPIEAVNAATEKQTIAGRISISGTPQFTKVLTVNTELLSPADATVVFEWKCGSSSVGDGVSYVPSAADIGKDLTVTVSGTGKYTGEIASAAVKVERCDVSTTDADLAYSHTYTHEPITPLVTVRNGNVDLVRDTDFTVEYVNNLNAGTATARIIGIGNYGGVKEVQFEIAEKPFSTLSVATIPGVYYTGYVVEPELTILHGEYFLERDVDYKAEFTDNVELEMATVTVTGINNYTGQIERTFRIIRHPIEGATVTTDLEEYAYTEYEIVPEVTVIVDGIVLRPGTDYELSFDNNIKEGTATVNVTGVGGFSGIATGTFKIIGHVYGEWIIRTEPTCTEDGVRFRVCSGCGPGAEGHEQTAAIPALGHDYHGVVFLPRCTEEGYTTYTCSRCEDSYDADLVDPLGHNYKVSVTPPTCAEDGFTTHTCSRCGDAYVDSYVDALGHDFGEDGKAVFCARCGAANPDYKPPVQFTDVKSGAYYADAVAWAVANNITAGTSATTFSPDKACTRGQVVTFLWRAAGQPEPTGAKNPFKDVKESDYFYKAVLWAVENGVTAGTGKTTFSPASTCTRGQIVTFLWRANGQPKATGSANPFKDVKSSDYFYTAVLWAVENGITAGTSKTTFAPGSTCTRGQVVTFLYRSVK